MKSKPNEDEAAFVLGDGDRFHSILTSDGVRYEVELSCETVITFFVVRRSSGLCDIFQVMKTFKGDACISRNVQAKLGIPADRIEKEVADIERVFSKGIQTATGYKMKWNRLDLTHLKGTHAQIAAISAWGRVGVRLGSDIPPFSQN